MSYLHFHYFVRKTWNKQNWTIVVIPSLQVYKLASCTVSSVTTEKKQHETPAHLWRRVADLRYLPSFISRKTGPHARTKWPWKRCPHHKKRLVLYTLSPTLTQERRKKTNPQTQQALFFLSLFSDVTGESLSRARWPPSQTLRCSQCRMGQTTECVPVLISHSWHRCCVCLTHSSKKLRNRTRTHKPTKRVSRQFM